MSAAVFQSIKTVGHSETLKVKNTCPNVILKDHIQYTPH